MLALLNLLLKLRVVEHARGSQIPQALASIPAGATKTTVVQLATNTVWRWFVCGWWLKRGLLALLKLLLLILPEGADIKAIP